MTEEEETQSKATIEKLYAELLDETLTPPEVKQRLIESTTIEQKERYVSIHKNQGKSNIWESKDSKLIESLKASKYPDIELLLDLRIRLTTASKDYVHEFIKHHGISTVLEVIANRASRRDMDEFDAAAIYEVLLSCKLVMNSSVGMKSFINDHNNSIDVIARCIDFEFKPLALLVLEILSVSCFSETSTTKVVKALKSMASLRGEAPFTALTKAIADADVELKAAVMEFINCIVVAADIDTRASLRSQLNNLKFDFHCEAAINQLDTELTAVESVGDGRPTLRKGVSVKKVMNVDKLGNSGRLVAFAGLRAASMKGSDAEKIQKFSSEKNLTKRSISIFDLNEEKFQSRGNLLVIPFIESGCMGIRKVLPLKVYHSIDDDGVKKHAGPQADSSVIMKIPIGQIRDVHETTNDRDLMQLINSASPNQPIYPLEIVAESQLMSMGFTKKSDRDDWIASIQSFRDKRLISKSSYSMQRTYLELRDALKSAERFRKLFLDYRSLATEEKQFSIENCGIDVNDIQAVYTFLKLELTAQGMENKLLAIFQEFLLVPSNSENIWNGILHGINHVVRLSRENADPDVDINDSMYLSQQFFNNERSLPELMKAKSEEEGGSYENFSKLALSIIEKDNEIEELKFKLHELEARNIANNSGTVGANLTGLKSPSEDKYKDRLLPGVPPVSGISGKEKVKFFLYLIHLFILLFFFSSFK
jgi:hypothetical protein